MHQALGQVAVARQQQQPLAVVVEAADRVDVSDAPVEQVEHRGSAFRVVPGGDVSLGLEQQDVARGGPHPDAPAIDPDVIAGGGAGPKGADDLAIDGHATIDNQLFRGTA